MKEMEEMLINFYSSKIEVNIVFTAPRSMLVLDQITGTNSMQPNNE